MPEQAGLKRSLSLPYVTFYGLGSILGAGIYVLIGEVAGRSGMFAPLSFLLAAVTAACTAMSIAELSARIPKGAGEAAFVEVAFGIRYLTLITGLLVIGVVLTSSATLARGFAGYFRYFFPVSEWIVISATVIFLGSLAAWGIKESALGAAIATIIEISGLCIIIWVSSDSLLSLPERLPELIPGADAASWKAIGLGSFLAFFAYIGFEDIVNVAEEVKNPQKNMPRAILLSFFISTMLYILVAFVVVLSTPISLLSGNEAPLSMIYQRNTGNSPALINVISLFAIINGALVQIIVASRIFYGLSRRSLLPGLFGHIHPKTGTPLFSTVISVTITLIMAFFFPLISLAEASSFIVLLVYILVNLSLIRIKSRDPKPEGIYTYPLWVPIAGFLICATVIVFLSMR